MGFEELNTAPGDTTRRRRAGFPPWVHPTLGPSAAGRNDQDLAKQVRVRWTGPLAGACEPPRLISVVAPPDAKDRQLGD